MSQESSNKTESPDVAAVQRRLSGHASTLGTLSVKLREIVDALPVPPNESDMLNDYVPKDVPTEIAGVLEYVVEEYLEPTRESLEKLARVTAEDLRRDLMKAKAKDMTIESGRRNRRRKMILISNRVVKDSR
jgi:hypothetical protein